MRFLKKLKPFIDFPTVLFIITFLICVTVLIIFPVSKECEDNKKIDLSLPEKEKPDPSCLKECAPVLWKRYYGTFSACSAENQNKLGDYAIKHGIHESIVNFQTEHGINEDGLFGKETQKICK